MSQFKPGEIVNVRIQNARVADDDGRTVKVTYGDGRYLIPLADDTTNVTIERFAPDVQTGTVPAFPLPALDMPCDCTTEAAQKLRADEYIAWSAEELAAYEKFSADHDGEWDIHEKWKKSPTYRELIGRQPESPGEGCVECDWKQRKLTDAGRQVLDFMRVWGAK
ncbi:hypothetical protein ACH4T9_12325 [Micromonospora sp. NPDC020750]|uniref:hypothetical protein n=1 Tax=unclassified Micromonospora TaxID=2617518 RepID=UPI00378A31DA